jgi:hypothetical protein
LAIASIVVAFFICLGAFLFFTDDEIIAGLLQIEPPLDDWE